MLRILLALLTLAAPAAGSEPAADAARADVVLIGEVHDNPGHHAVQAALVDRLQPAALVVEMLTAGQAGRIADILATDPDGAAERLGWEQAGWPDFEMYRPIFTASQARVYGAAVPRDVARAAFETGIADSFGEGAAVYGLNDPLPEAEQAAREALQFEAHCDALPRDLLPRMVALQRLRDAVLARAVLQALDDTGGPVVVITGNGHARTDWGVPRYVLRLRPGLALYSIGQGEDDTPPEGTFDVLRFAPAVARPDPCAAFR